MMPTQSILIVEDERIVALDLRAMLRQLGYHVPAVVGTGAQAIAQATAHRPDLILMDIRLQGPIDGIETAETILAHFDVPIIYLTAFADDMTRLRARQTAPYGYLTKPFDERSLQTTVEMALERHARDRRSRSREQLLAVALANVAVGVVATDALGRILFVNPAAERMLRRTEPDLIGQAVAEAAVLVDTATRVLIEHPVLAALRLRAPVQLQGTVLLIGRDGSAVAVDVSVAPISAAPEHIQGAVVLFQEHAEGLPAAETDHTKVENVRQLDRLRVLASGIAHDFNNLLAGVLGNAELAHFELPDESPAHGALHEIERITQRAATLTRQLRTYAGDTPIMPEPLDLALEARDVVALFSKSIPAHIRIETNLALDLPLVEGDRIQLHQMMRNVLLNAVEAIGTTEGSITISADLRHLSEADLREATLGGDQVPGWYVALTVADTGCGMDAETLSWIFEPFFSTKFVGRGLGLAAVLGIIREHDGIAMVQSAPEAGTTFTICLPCALIERTVSSSQASQMDWSCRGTVLVIDDDDGVRTTAVRLLEHLGCAVVLAADGPTGLEVFQAHIDTISCVLLDLTMPGMSGTEVAAAIRGMKPDIPIIMMSGYSKAHVAVALVEAAHVYVLPKPFRIDDLQLLLRRALQGEARERNE